MNAIIELYRDSLTLKSNLSITHCFLFFYVIKGFQLTLTVY